jgi:DNA replication protein DnaC
MNLRQQHKIALRTRAAGFHGLKTLDGFDWHFNPEIPRKDIYQLATGQFIREATGAIFLGPSGTGKSHTALAIGYEAIKQGHTVLCRSIFDLVRDLMAEEALPQKDHGLRHYLKPDLLIIEDFAGKQLPKHSGEYLLEVIMRRYENRSVLVTSNRPLEDWGKLFQDVPVAGAILDRLLHHSKLVIFAGRSYRLKDVPEFTTKIRPTE